MSFLKGKRLESVKEKRDKSPNSQLHQLQQHIFKFGRIQGRLAWPLYKVDMQILEVSLMVPEAEASCAAYRVFNGYV